MITVLSILINTSCSASNRIPLFNYCLPFPLSILARLRNKKEIAALISKIQNSQKDPKQQNKSPLTENESGQIQTAIQEMLLETQKSIREQMQEFSDKKKCFLYFESKTDVQLAPGLFVPIIVFTAPTKGLTKEEAEYVKTYSANFSEFQEKIKSILEKIFKEIPQSDQNLEENPKDKSATQPKPAARVRGA